MNRVKIDIIRLGESKYTDEWNFLKKLKKKRKSNLFEILNINQISLPQSDFVGKNDTCENVTCENDTCDFWGYTDSSLLNLIRVSEEADYTLCFIDYPLEDDYFTRRLSANIAVATFYETNKIFSEWNVDLKNFILLQIYLVVTFSKLSSDNAMESLLEYFHDETRGCLFDMCGIKEDIIVSATNPKLCFECETKFRKIQLDVRFLDTLKKELRRIKKSLYFRITDWIKKHPIFSLIIATTFTVLLNLISSFIFDLITG